MKTIIRAFIITAICTLTSVQVAFANQCEDCQTNLNYLLENIRIINDVHRSPTIDHAYDIAKLVEKWAFSNRACYDFNVKKQCYETCLEVVKKSDDLKYGRKNCSSACL